MQVKNSIKKNIAHAVRGGQCSVTPDKNDQAGIEGLINQVAIDVDGSVRRDPQMDW